MNKTAENFVALVEATEPAALEDLQGQRARGTKSTRVIVGNLPVIEIGFDEPRVVNQAIEALAAQDNVYQRAAMLVQVVRGDPPPRGIARPKDAPRIVPVRQPRLRELLAASAVWQKDCGEEIQQCHVPDWVIKEVDARGQWSGVRNLVGVVEVPVLRADGTILQTAGYDGQTGLIFDPQIVFPEIPERPTRDDARRAVASLLEVIEEFPYPSDHHKSGWLSAVITPLVRYAIAGPAPLHLFDANAPGSGKTLQADSASMIVTGRPAAKMAMSREDEEMRKRITAVALADERIVLIDNVPSTLGGASLDAALTATSWSDRLLGESKMATGIPLYTTWMATGNNVIIVGDTGRRTLPIRLESRDEHPEERSGFRHPNLLAWVLENRGRLAAAAVVIPGAYCAAGRPDMRLKPWGSYDDWSALVRASLVWAGMPDPAATRANIVSQSDREAAALRALIAGWREADPAGDGLTCAEAVQLLEKHPNAYQTLRAALLDLATSKGSDRPNPRSLAMKLHHVRQRVVGGHYFDSRDRNHTAVWFVAGSAEGAGREVAELREVATPDAPAPPRTCAPAHAHEEHTATGSTSRSSATSLEAEESEVAAWTG